MKTDLLVSDGNNFYRIQVKTIESHDESHVVENKWGRTKIDYVIYFSREDNWDYILKPFSSELNDLTQLLVSVFIRILGILSKPLIRFRDWTPMDNISLFIA
jgi:hypothetical protein